MAKLIALEWDTREARIAVGTARGSEVVVEQAFAVDLGVDSPDEAPSTAAISAKLSEALTSQGLTGADSLVALPRSNIELRVLTLPPAPPEERPEMVRFQAMQAFTAIGEDWPLDYVELDSSEESTDVLAAVVSPNQIAVVKKVCNSADLKPHRLVLRPFATASLLRRVRSLDANRNRLIVEVLDAEADVTAVFNGQVVFMRTVRLPTDAKVRPAALAGELRRTIGAAQNQMSGSRLEQIVICGGDDECATLKEHLTGALSLEVVTLDPLAAVRVSRSLRSDGLDHSGRFAALFGMLSDEVSGGDHGIDFFNPRKRPAPPSKKRRNVVMATAALFVVGIAALGVWFQLHQLDGEIALRVSQTAEMDKTLDTAKGLREKTDAVKEFTDGDITWLDEVHEVARYLPDSDTAILEEVTMGTSDTRGGGTMLLKGNVISSAMIEEFEDSLRHSDNIVSGKQGTIDRTKPDYPWLLDAAVIVAPDKQEAGHSIGRPFRDAIREELEQVRQAKEQVEKERAALQKAEEERVALEQAEAERAALEQAEADEGDAAEADSLESNTPEDEGSADPTPGEELREGAESTEEVGPDSETPTENPNADSTGPSSEEPENTSSEKTEIQPS